MFVGAILANSTGRADPLSTEPLIGVASEYSSNPYLLSAGARSVNDVALLINAPTHYDADWIHLSLLPSIRYSDSGSYASLNSNSFHLNSTATLQSDLNTLSLEAGAGRDSSLYQNGLSSNGVGVRADGTFAGAGWQRAISERATLVLDANWSRAVYNQNANSAGLVDYHYSSLASSAAYALNERNKLNITAGAGEYQAADGITESKNYNLQLGLDRQLTELWTLSLSAGYAKSDNSEKIYEGPFYIGTIELGPYLVGTVESEQKGPVYNTSLTRQGETVTFKASASRSFLPSGFEFLSRQDIAVMDWVYVASERWKFTTEIKYQANNNPLSDGAQVTSHYYSGQLSANWHWTPTWVISMQTTWVKSKYEVPFVSAQSTGASLEISRQFLRIDL
jgi:hypothetical protein